MSRVVGGEREGSVNLFIVGIKVVTYAVFLRDRVNWTVVQCEKNRPRTEPCGTPKRRDTAIEFIPEIETD